MKLILSKDPKMSEEGAVLVQDINVLDIFCEDAEADKIHVDDFISQYSYEEAGNVINKIISKLRLNGELVFDFIDIGLLSLKFSSEMITIEEFNAIAFSCLRKSFLNLQIYKDLLTQSGVKVSSIINVDEYGRILIKGVRHA